MSDPLKTDGKQLENFIIAGKRNKMATLNRNYLNNQILNPITGRLIQPTAKNTPARVITFQIGEKHFEKLLELMDRGLYFSISEAIRFVSLFYLSNHSREISPNLDEIKRDDFFSDHVWYRMDVWKEKDTKPKNFHFKQLPVSVKIQPQFVTIIDDFCTWSQEIKSRSDFFRKVIDFSFEMLASKAFWRI